MAVKKTELYSSLWASCDALRGGMDASQYKDYILTLLFMKYVTDKYKGQKYGDLTVFDKANDPNPDPEKRTGCSFDDFIALKNKKNIGEGIDKIIARLAEVNEGLKGVIDIAHFNDEAKIGKDKEMVDKLTKLIAIFQRPELDFSNINKIAEIYKDCTKLPIHERHPYVGDLVFTAFSGSHQDAIRKGMKARESRGEYVWQVPYLPLDPHDLGREYKEIIRINSQSGKGGAAYIMESEFGYNMPKAMQKYFGKVVKRRSDSMGKELSPQEIFNLFEKWYINIETPYKLTKYKISSVDSDSFDVDSNNIETNNLLLEAVINFNGHDYTIKGTGNGPVDAFSNALMQQDEEELKSLKNYKFVHYHEHALGEGSHVKGVAYIQIDTGCTEPYFGVGISENINTAAISALMNAINKSYIKMDVN